MVGNSYSPSPSSRALDIVEGAKDRFQEMWDQRRPPGRDTVRKALLLGFIAVAGAALLMLPDPNDKAVAVFALEAPEDPEAPAADESTPEPTVEVADETEEAEESNPWLDALTGSKAAAEIELTRFTQRAESAKEATTTTAAPTTQAPTTRAPTTEAPTTTEASTTSADSGETTESTDTTAAETTGSTDSTDSTDTTGDETTSTETTPTTEAETTTTTAAPTTTTAAGNGFVDAGHGVMVPPILLQIRYCESRDNYTAANPSSSARGAYQFLTGSWAGYGHRDRYGVSQAHLATPAQQDEAALITWQRDGTRPWNASRHCWG